MKTQNVLVVGAGVAGMKASLLLAQAGVKVHLIEKESLIGGQTIKFEEVYPNMECATCMVAPIQQDVLQNENIDVSLLSTIKKISEDKDGYTVDIEKKARYVSLENCIGCNACFEPCPVELDNPFEENLSKKKAISVPCPGALPNVPNIDPVHCLRLNGKKKDCKACQEACMFDAVDFTQKDEKIQLKVGAVIIATGFDMFDVKSAADYGYGKHPNVYTAMEFERLYAQNGPTEGEFILRDNKPVKSIGIIHCVGRKEMGYCSGVCCMYSAKIAQFLKHKAPEAKIQEFYKDLCIPGKSHQKFYEATRKKGVDFIHFDAIRVGSSNGNIEITSSENNAKEEKFTADLVILSPVLTPGKDTGSLAKTLGLERDAYGFFSTLNGKLAPVITEKEGIFIAGCAEGPKDIPESIAQAEAAVGKALSYIQ